MTLKTSLFNKGIYKSTVRRYLWGAVLYFIILFMSTVLPILLTVEADDTYRYMGENNLSLLYDNGTYLFLPITIAMGVATVVGLLVYRFIHSKKASVFTHSLPVNRTSVYTSTLAGAFTLMFVPVILNGLIFLVMALTSYSKIISVSSCFVWIGLNLLCLFMMFACTTFVAMLTGNTFATVALNVLFHALVPVVVVCFGFVAEQFLYGYVTDNAVMNSVAEGNFVAWIYANVTHLCYGYNDVEFEFVRMYIYLGISALLYVLGWVLYKKRNLETAEDVAGFKILNPIFKYLITFVGVIATFTVFGSFISHNPVTFWIIVAIIGVVIYFACEMILKKTLKVWGSYKGLIGFAVVFALMICVFAFTSFFGYETYVPDADEVESVAVYSYYYDDIPTLNDPEIIDYAIKLHSEFAGNRALLKPEFDGNYVGLHIEYKLKNGDEVPRRYRISESRLGEILNDLYKYESYKAVFEEPLAIDVNDIEFIEYDSEQIYGDFMVELHKCVVDDIKNMSHTDIYSVDPKSSAEEFTYHYWAEGYDGNRQMHTRVYYLSPHFEKTKEWLANNLYKLYYNYADQIYEDSSFCLVKLERFEEMSKTYGKLGFVFESLSWSRDGLIKGDVCKEITEFNLKNENIILVEGEDAEIIYDYIQISDHNLSSNGVWYIYGEIAPDDFRIIDTITSDEFADFKQYVCR